MSSIIKVDSVQDQSGNNIINENSNTITIGASGDTVNVVGTLQNNGAAIPGDISSVVAGTGLSGGGTSGAVTVNIEAAQPTVTSTGTLTSFRSTGIDDNADALAMTIDSSERVGIGTTSPAGVVGTDKVLEIAGSSNPGLVINDTGQAEKYAFHALATKLNMYYGTTAFLTYDASTSGVGINNASPSQSLDVTGSIEVSDGIYIGGTGTANKLDDYEEGTFTPSFSATSCSFSFSQQHGFYTKIGRLVTVNIFIRAQSSGSTSNALKITALPFTSTNSSAGYYASVYFGQIESIDYPSGALEITGSIGSNSTQIDLQYSRDNAGSLNLPASAIDGATSNGFMVSATYITA